MEEARAVNDKAALHSSDKRSAGSSAKRIASCCWSGGYLKLELPRSCGQMGACDASGVIVLPSGVVHGAAAGPYMAGGERRGG